MYWKRGLIVALTVLFATCQRSATGVNADLAQSQRNTNGSANGSDTTITSQPPQGGGGGGGGGSDSTVTPPSNRPVSSIAVKVSGPPGMGIFSGDSLGFSATLKDDAGAVLSGRTVEWSSSSPAVEIQWSSGNFALGRAKLAGTAVITATSEGKTGSVTVEVQ